MTLPTVTIIQSLDSRIASGLLPKNLDEVTRTSQASCPAANRAASTAKQGVSSVATDLEGYGETVSRRHEDLCLGRRALAILDGMTICEIAWHEGGSLPETLYACLYLHQQAFTAILSDLGWELPAISPTGGVPPNIDLGIYRGMWGTRTLMMPRGKMPCAFI